MNFKKLFILTIIFISLIGIVTGIVPNPGHSWAQLEMPSLTATFPNIVANNNIYARAGILNDQTANDGMVFISDTAGLRIDGDHIDSGIAGALYLDPDSDGANTVYIGKSSTDTEGDDLLLPDGYLKVCSGGDCPIFSTATGDGELAVEGDLEVDGTLDVQTMTRKIYSTKYTGTLCGGLDYSTSGDTEIGIYGVGQINKCTWPNNATSKAYFRCPPGYIPLHIRADVDSKITYVTRPQILTDDSFTEIGVYVDACWANAGNYEASNCLAGNGTSQGYINEIEVMCGRIN